MAEEDNSDNICFSDEELYLCEELDLRENNITDEQAIRICQTFLPQMPNLRKLYLNGNNIRHTSSIFPMVTRCSSLEVLSICDNEMTGNIGEEIKMMNKMRIFSASGNNLTSVDISLFMIPTLVTCLLSGNSTLIQPPYAAIEACQDETGNCMPKMKDDEVIAAILF